MNAPVEPTGLGAVVEDDEGGLWVRVRTGAGVLPWRLHGHRRCEAAWSCVYAVKVLSEGVAS